MRLARRAIEEELKQSFPSYGFPQLHRADHHPAREKRRKIVEERQTRIGLMLADAEFNSERNHTYMRQQLGAQSVIPAKRGKRTWCIHGVRAEMRRAFPRRLYRRRALIESHFSSVKRKLSARAPGRSLRMQMRQALVLGLRFNLSA